MKIPIDDCLRERLRQVRRTQWADMLAGRPQMVDEVFLEQDVVRLMSGGGHAAYLTNDGRIITINYGEGLPAGELRDPKDFASVLIRWASDIGMPELVDLLPLRPSDGEVCMLCKGTRYMPPGIFVGQGGEPTYCRRRGGLGWTFSVQPENNEGN